MKIPRLRFTVRRLMIVVVVVAVVLASAAYARHLKRRREHYRAVSFQYLIQLSQDLADRDLSKGRENELRQMAKEIPDVVSGEERERLATEFLRKAEYYGQQAERHAERARYHARMKDKDDAAATRVWVPIDFDPPQFEP